MQGREYVPRYERLSYVVCIGCGRLRLSTEMEEGRGDDVMRRASVSEAAGMPEVKENN